MSDTSRSPFRRFPYVQLVFCVACLTMAAWTWMRYSYAWEVSPTDVVPEVREPLNPWSESYVAIRGDTLLLKVITPSPDWRAEPWAVMAERKTAGSPEPAPSPKWVKLENIPEIVRLYQKETARLRVIADDERTGRYSWEPGISPWDVRVNYADPYYHGYLTLSASRFHPASIAGIVVGAMGAFVFGLYLRRWVKERRAGG